MLTYMYSEYLAARELPPPMRTGTDGDTPSRAYKTKLQGGRALVWGVFPLSVSGAESKILAKAMQLQLDDV